jgi:hypothetical protein
LRKFFASALFRNENPSHAKLLLAGLLFLILTPIVLWLDSDYFFNRFSFYGRWLANSLTIIYFLWLFVISGTQLRKLIFTMVIVSYIGELIFCTWLGMYAYRTEHIPLYVPLGHAIVYSSGYIYAHSQIALQQKALLNKVFPVLFVLIFLIPVVFLNDMFTLIFSFFFFAVLKRKRWDNLYYFIALCVIYIELLGTALHCWKWVPETFGVIPAANPPMGAVFFYAGGDVIIAKIVSVWGGRKKK